MKHTPTFAIWLRSIVFNICVVLITIIHATLSLFTFFLPYPLRYRFITLWAHLLMFCAKYIGGMQVKIHGAENIPKKSVVIMCNHQSMWETMALQVFFPRQTWVLKRELLRVPFFGWALALLRPIAISRKNPKIAMAQLMTKGKKVLQSGTNVVIFPEGSRSPAGEVAKFKQGAAALAVSAGYPIIRVAHNAGDCWPKRSFLKYPGIIHVIIGMAIPTTEKTNIAALTENSRDWMATQLHHIRKLQRQKSQKALNENRS